MTTKKLSKQQLATATILEIAYELLNPGRPRKLPGKPRAIALTSWNSEVSYLSPNAVRFSVEGAVNKAAYAIRFAATPATLSRARHEAHAQIIEALNCTNGLPLVTSLDEADNLIADTRAVRRAVKQAAKQYA